MREYNTSVISHDLAYSTQALSTQPIRYTNTFRSSVLETAPVDAAGQAKINNKSANQLHYKSRDKLQNERPLTSKVQRTSYQDSNIFGYKPTEDITVQKSAKQEQANSRIRATATYNSKVFDNLDGSY